MGSGGGAWETGSCLGLSLQLNPGWWMGLRAVCLRDSLMRKPLLWILLLAFGARVAMRWYSGEEDFWVNGYGFLFELAQSIAAGKGIAFDGGFPTASRVPMYPAFLALVTFGHELFLPVLIS